ncbi:MAG TPA: hypothetical protein VFE47_15410 [Tepidisphaeraceae bacterium]|jgi:hypothetical protein|nr:hypothetical protein [Tepidisphaeraceae bacterium]
MSAEIRIRPLRAHRPQTRRLAIDESGKISIYDTADHVITAVSRQQSDRGQTLAFINQHGNVTPAKLRKVL